MKYELGELFSSKGDTPQDVHLGMLRKVSSLMDARGLAGDRRDSSIGDPATCC